MKALQITAPGQAAIVEVPKPSPKVGEALIRPTVLSLCGSDIYMYKYAPLNEYPYPPGSSGHEMIGIIEAVNGPYTGPPIGSPALVIAPPQLAMSEYYVTPLKHIIPVPDGVPAEHLVQAQQLGTVIYAAKQLPNIVGKRVAVIGQGSAGQWWNFMLNRLGAERVIGIDLVQHRLRHSQHFGATHILHNGSGGVTDLQAALKKICGGMLPEFVIEAGGEADSINLAVDIVADDGFILQFGVPHLETLEFDYYKMFRKCLTLKSVVFASREPGHSSTVRALELISSGAIDVSPIITHRFAFDEVLKAYELQETRADGALKIIVDMNIV